MAKLSLADLQTAVTAAREALANEPENAALKAELEKAVAALAKEEEALAKAKDAGKVEVRVLVDHGGHAADSVTSLTADEAKAAVKAGWADDDKAAVAFAKKEAAAQAKA